VIARFVGVMPSTGAARKLLRGIDIKRKTLPMNSMQIIRRQEQREQQCTAAEDCNL
jgi:hypothetical protein